MTRLYGLVPTRADRCTYVLYGKKSATADAELRKSQPKSMESAIDYLLDPIAGNNARGREVHGVVCLHVCWTKACVDATASTPAHVSANQNLAVEAVEEITLDKKLNNEQPCTPQQHTAYRSVLGQILSSRCPYKTLSPA